jgi:hypothetical protein
MVASIRAVPTRSAPPLVRRLLLTVMLAAIALPLPLTLMVQGSPARVRQALASPLLHDNAEPLRRPRVRPTTWWRGQFQRDFEAWFGSVIEPRGWIVG